MKIYTIVEKYKRISLFDEFMLKYVQKRNIFEGEKVQRQSRTDGLSYLFQSKLPKISAGRGTDIWDNVYRFFSLFALFPAISRRVNSALTNIVYSHKTNSSLLIQLEASNLSWNYIKANTAMNNVRRRF